MILFCLWHYIFLQNLNLISYLKDFNCSLEEHGVLKYTNEKLLIYLKPATSFYSADHSPLICWKGSGYNFDNEKIILIENQDVYYSVLSTEKGDKLYTIWWYDNVKSQTISQLKWRFDMMLGAEAYRLINVTCSTKEAAIKEAKKLLSTKDYL